MLNVPVSARPTSVVIAAAVYLLGLYAFVLTTGKEAAQQRRATRRVKGKAGQPIEAFVAAGARPAMASRATAPAGRMLVLPNGTMRPGRLKHGRTEPPPLLTVRKRRGSTSGATPLCV